MLISAKMPNVNQNVNTSYSVYTLQITKGHLNWVFSKPAYLPLKQFQEHGTMAAGHLGVVELKGDWEGGL